MAGAGAGGLAASTSRESNTARGTARAGRRIVPRVNRSPRASSRSGTGVQSSTMCPSPNLSSTPSTCGAMPSPHALSRGKSARSRSRTRASGRSCTAARAAVAPAGPAPTTTRSQHCAGVSQQSSLPVDTLFGRWMHDTGWAGALVTLGFAGSSTSATKVAVGRPAATRCRSSTRPRTRWCRRSAPSRGPPRTSATRRRASRELATACCRPITTRPLSPT